VIRPLPRAKTSSSSTARPASPWSAERLRAAKRAVVQLITTPVAAHVRTASTRSSRTTGPQEQKVLAFSRGRLPHKTRHPASCREGHRRDRRDWWPPRSGHERHRRRACTASRCPRSPRSSEAPGRRKPRGLGTRSSAPSIPGPRRTADGRADSREAHHERQRRPRRPGRSRRRSMRDDERLEDGLPSTYPPEARPLRRRGVRLTRRREETGESERSPRSGPCEMPEVDGRRTPRGRPRPTDTEDLVTGWPETDDGPTVTLSAIWIGTPMHDPLGRVRSAMNIVEKPMTSSSLVRRSLRPARGGHDSRTAS